MIKSVTMCPQKQLLDSLQQHVQSLNIEKCEKTTFEIKNEISKLSKINYLIQETLNKEESLNEQLKKKLKYYEKLQSDKRQEYVNSLMKDKNTFEDVMDDTKYLELKIKLKEGMKRELEVHIDDETKKLTAEKEMIFTAHKELEIQSIISNETQKKISTHKEQCEVLKNECKIKQFELQNSKRLQLENKIKLTVADKFKKNVLLHMNSLVQIENAYRRTGASLNKIRKLNEITNKKLIEIILAYNLVGLAENVKLLLQKLDDQNASYHQVSVEIRDRKNISNEHHQLSYIHLDYYANYVGKTFIKDRTCVAPKDRQKVLVNDLDSSKEKINLKKVDSLCLSKHLLQCRRTGGGDFNPKIKTKINKNI